MTVSHVMLHKVREIKTKMAKSLLIPLTVIHGKAGRDRVENMSVNLGSPAEDILDRKKKVSLTGCREGRRKNRAQGHQHQILRG